ncbi:TerB N-terminal domain-containing protein [Pilimelia columellifera]|uniref:TerB N-terminal domain-containing protein n=1 Tax=Pilimelia columellifera subsp. columellifera TaxID=706583 RepID=A0ABN3NK85_9ACTN
MTTSTTHAPPGRARATDAVWLPTGAAPVAVGGYVLSGGLFYYGTAGPAAYGPGSEPAVIDPTLPIRRVWLDQETPADRARPRYGDLTPGARAAYLEWLAAGRTGPAPVAHLWLFLAGLERRVLHDLGGGPEGLADYVAIAAEVARLRRQHRRADAFDAQAAEFTALLAGVIALGDPDLTPPDPQPGHASPRLVAGIGRYLAAGQAVPSRWAYAWHAACAPTVLDEADFADRFARSQPDGLRLPTPPQPLVFTYRPVSAGFGERTVTLRTPVPDVRSLDAALATPFGGDLSPRAAAAGALLPLIVLAGADDELLEVVCRHLYDVHHLTGAERVTVDASVRRLGAQAPDLGVVRDRFSALPVADQDEVARLLIATASVDAIVEPDHAQLLAAAFDVLGPGEPDLWRRLRALEVVAVVTEDDRVDTTATVLDEAMVAEALGRAPTTAATVSELLAPEG